MLLKNLTIERILYGDNKGQYKATITVDEEAGPTKITLEIPAADTQEILSHVKGRLLNATQKAASDLRNRIERTIPTLLTHTTPNP